MLISTVGCFFCLFGTATYAHFLKIVPGFAINNVVVNASALVPQEKIISLENITRIFETEEKALMLQSNNYLSMHTKFSASTIYPDQNFNEEENNTTYMHFRPNLQEINNITKRDVENITDYYEDTTLTFIDLPTSVPNNNQSVNNTQNNVITPQDPTSSTMNPKKSSIKQVADEILLPIPKQEKNNLAWIPLILLLGSAFFAHLGIRLIPWILIGEVFPASVRSTASGIVSATGYIFGFLANKLFLQMLATLTMPGTFWFYSVVALTGAIVLYFTLPETEGRTLGVSIC